MGSLTTVLDSEKVFNQHNLLFFFIKTNNVDLFF